MDGLHVTISPKNLRQKMLKNTDEKNGLQSNGDTSPSGFSGAIRGLFDTLKRPFTLPKKRYLGIGNEEDDKNDKNHPERAKNTVLKRSIGTILPEKTSFLKETEKSGLYEVLLPKNMVVLDFSDDSDLEITDVVYPSRKTDSFSSPKIKQNTFPQKSKLPQVQVPPKPPKPTDFLAQKDILPPELSEQRIPQKRKKFKRFERNKKHVIVNPSSESEIEDTPDSSFNAPTPSKPPKKHLESFQRSRAEISPPESKKIANAVVANVESELPQENTQRTISPDNLSPKTHASDHQSSSQVERLGVKSNLFRFYVAQLTKEIEEAERLELEISLADLEAGLVDEEDVSAEIDNHFMKFNNLSLLDQVEGYSKEKHPQNEQTETRDHENITDPNNNGISRNGQVKAILLDTESSEESEGYVETGTGDQFAINTVADPRNTDKQKESSILEQVIGENTQVKPKQPTGITVLVPENVEKDLSTENPFRYTHRISSIPESPLKFLKSANIGVETPLKSNITLKGLQIEQVSPFFEEDYLISSEEDREKQRTKNRKRRYGYQRKMWREQRKNGINGEVPKPSNLEKENSNEGQVDVQATAKSPHTEKSAAVVLYNLQSSPPIPRPSNDFLDIPSSNEDNEWTRSVFVEPEVEYSPSFAQRNLSVSRSESNGRPEKEKEVISDENDKSSNVQHNILQTHSEDLSQVQNANMSSGTHIGKTSGETKKSSPKLSTQNLQKTNHFSPEFSLPLPVSDQESPEVIIISLGSSSRSSVISLQAEDHLNTQESQNLRNLGMSQFPNDTVDFGGTVIPNSSQSIQASQRRNPLTSQIAINSSQESQINSSIASLNHLQGLRRSSGAHMGTSSKISQNKSSEQVKPKDEPESKPKTLAEIMKENFVRV